ncbi:hypothetical protein JCM8097_000357 [Rhodosporidiobolus ruineniae]
MSSSSVPSTVIPPFPPSSLFTSYTSPTLRTPKTTTPAAAKTSSSVACTRSIDLLAQQSIERRRTLCNLAFRPPNPGAHLQLTPEQVRQACRLFPNVVHFRLGGYCSSSDPLDRYPLLSDYECYGMEYLTPLSSPDRLIQQLETLEVDANFTEEAEPVLRHPCCPVLFKLSEVDLRLHAELDCFAPSVPYPPRHLRLDPAPFSWSALGHIFRLPHRPDSLFLPLLPSAPADSTDVDDVSARETFLERCKNAGVEVRYYRPVKEEWREVGCAEFREYVEERKTREAEGP